MKIPFDIKFRPQIESGEYKVVTAKGQSVRIICLDRSTTYWKIIALVLAPDGKTENPFTYDVNGNESDGCLHNHELDLFIITPEPELSEWQTLISGCLQKHGLLDCGAADRIAKESTAELLALATEELKKTFVLLHKEDYQTAFDLGKAEALKDLPRWREWGNGAAGNSDGHPIALVSGAGGIRFVSILGTAGEKYIMLNDLKKLPGFKED